NIFIQKWFQPFTTSLGGVEEEGVVWINARCLTEEMVGLFQLIDIVILLSLSPGGSYLRHRQTVVGEYQFVDAFKVGACLVGQRLDKGRMVVIGLHEPETERVGSTEKDTPYCLFHGFCCRLGIMGIEWKDHHL